MKDYLKTLFVNNLFWGSVFVFTLSFLVLQSNSSKPFVGIHDWNGARYGNIAKNYLIYGAETKLGQVEYLKLDGTFQYYTRYPPLLPLSIAASYKAFGVSEWSTRIVPIIYTSLMLMAVFLAGSILWNLRVGLFASLFLLATPMIRYFGKNPVHEPMVGAFALLVFLGLALLLNGKKGTAAWALVFGGSILAALSGWGGYFVVPAVLLVFLHLKIRKAIYFAYLAVMAVLFLGHFAFVNFLTGSFLGGGLGETFLYRSGQEAREYTFLEFFSQVRLWATTLFTVSLLAFSALFVFVAKNQRNDRLVFLLGLLIFGSFYPLIFSNATYIHNYFIFNLAPFLGLLAAVAVDRRSLPILILILLIVAFERNSLFLALEKSDQDSFAYEVAKAIRENTSPGDKVAITPASFANSAEKFIFFYSDRKVYFDDYPDERFHKTVIVDEELRSYIITPNE